MGKREKILCVINMDSFLWKRNTLESVLAFSSRKALQAAIQKNGFTEYYTVKVPLPLCLLVNAGAVDKFGQTAETFLSVSS